MKQKLALIGFGTVGQGLCEILLSKKEYLKKMYDFEWEVVAVSDMLKGSVYAPDGLDVPALLDLVSNGKSLEEYTGDAQRGWDALTTIRQSNADIVCEMTYTDIKSGKPATDHCRAALESGKHVVTSNKGPAALFYNELADLAQKNNVRFLIEGTVMSGTPVLNLASNELAGNSITAVRGILNGTTNFILTNMEAGRSYEEVLKEAQELGYAEADPTADVEGFDALAKVTILANVVMGARLKPDDIPCKGITAITLDDIEQARQEGKRWKLIGEVKKEGGKVSASVAPMKVELSHPLAGVSGAVNAVTFSTDLMGDVTITGAGAGRIETGFSILTDILEIHKGSWELIKN
ncbi:MAG TPA: homoserine dehydrogenase [Caldithrix abyssi]|uniref:Homoserine dehydrogenase n=1 Tax=Caldithrix abyssi TaxID=187145 RepID=A0A7V4WTF7_CALAY|nr:homoserine dehydrogenase [Caldithrix abyssi]